MRYCIRKETTGRIGSADFQRDLQTLRVFDTREEAIEGIRWRREQLSRCKVDLYGSQVDYFAVLRSGRQAVVHNWVEEENAEQKAVFELNVTETERLKRFAAAHRLQRVSALRQGGPVAPLLGLRLGGVHPGLRVEKAERSAPEGSEGRQEAPCCGTPHPSRVQGRRDGGAPGRPGHPAGCTVTSSGNAPPGTFFRGCDPDFLSGRLNHKGELQVGR